MKYKIGFIILVSYILLYAIHYINGAPTYFEKYREKRIKIRENRLKYERAKKRWNDTSTKIGRISRGLHKAREQGIPAGNTNHRTWLKKHMKQEAVETNMHLHTLASKVFKVNPEISEIFNHQANNLKSTNDDLMKQKDKLKEKGKFKEELILKHNIKDLDQLEKLSDKDKLSRTIMSKTKKYLDKHDRFPNRCSILK